MCVSKMLLALRSCRPLRHAAAMGSRPLPAGVISPRVCNLPVSRWASSGGESSSNVEPAAEPNEGHAAQIVITEACAQVRDAQVLVTLHTLSHQHATPSPSNRSVFCNLIRRRACRTRQCRDCCDFQWSLVAARVSLIASTLRMRQQLRTRTRERPPRMYPSRARADSL